MNIFDDGHALFGSVAGQGQQRLQAMRDLLGLSGTPTEDNQHYLLDVIAADTDFGKWMIRIGLTAGFLHRGGLPTSWSGSTMPRR